MRIGLFTPIHKLNKEELEFLCKSIKKQTKEPYMWAILLNGKAVNQQEEILEVFREQGVYSFIRVEISKNENNIGKLKSECCKILIEQGNCDLLVELDYDDALREDAIEKLYNAARNNPNAVFFYSNFAHFKFLDDGLVESRTYSRHYGWNWKKHYNEDLFGSAVLNEMLCFPALPQYLSRIESSPNHLRAFRTIPYNKINGYSNLEVGDDHDLMCRFFLEYGEKGFHHIKECLYYQRMGDTTTMTRNADIQKQVKINYIKYMEGLFKRWSKDNNLDMLDLGGRFNCPKDYKSVDLLDADYIIDLNEPVWKNHKNINNPLEGYGPLATNSVGILRAYHLIEHLDNPINFFNEAYRILAPGGLLLLEVPSLKHPAAFADPTHKSFWDVINFAYYTNENKAKFIRPQYKGAFLPLRIEEYKWSDGTIVISGQLLALKDWYNKNWWGDKNTDEAYIRNGNI